MIHINELDKLTVFLAYKNTVSLVLGPNTSDATIDTFNGKHSLLFG